jgi:hypothetical protein
LNISVLFALAFFGLNFQYQCFCACILGLNLSSATKPVFFFFAKN